MELPVKNPRKRRGLEVRFNVKNSRNGRTRSEVTCLIFQQVRIIIVRLSVKYSREARILPVKFNRK